MGRRDHFSPFFQRMLDEPEAAVAALRDDPSAFEREVIDVEAESHVAQAALPDRRALGFLLFDVNGERMPLDSPSWLPHLPNRDCLMQYIDPRSSDGRLLCISPEGAPLLFGLWAPYSETAGWNLPHSIRQQAEARGAGTIALFAGNTAEPIEAATAAFGLPPFQQRVVAAVTRTGNLRRAAAELGISYSAAREAMAAATRRLHLTNTPAVVRAVVAAAFGVLPDDVESPALLADSLSISERQARAALLISSGLSREATARAIGSSPPVVNKELQLLFSSLGVQSAAELARFITEAQALRLFARAIDNAPGFLDPAIEPARYTMRRNGRGRIAWSDYGPASGRPVLIVHSNWCCRAVPVPLLRELQKRGWRPVAIDRPGFGATHLGTSSKDNPFDQAVEDALQILGELKVERIPVIARCGAQFVHALASKHPERLGPVVLVSPTPQAHDNGKRFGAVGAFKEAFYRSPRLVELFFRVISAQFSFERVEQLMRSITKDSVDATLCDDPQFIRDRFRALRPFACGGYVGGIIEELVISHGGWDFQPLSAARWTVLQGAADLHNHFDEVSDYWGKILPRSVIEEVEGGGRFLTSTHPALIVDRLMGT